MKFILDYKPLLFFALNVGTYNILFVGLCIQLDATKAGNERMRFIVMILIANNKETYLLQNRPPAGCLFIQSF